MRERQRTGTGGGSLETQAPFSSATFKLPLTNTLAPVGGYGPATFTRTTTATYFDNEGMLKEVRAGAARFTGARRVGNLFPSSENFAFGWLATGSSIIGTNVMKVNSGTQPAYLYLNPAISVIANRLYTVKFRVIFNNHSVFQLCASSTGFGTGQFVNFDLQQSSLSATGCTAKITMVSTNTADLEATFLATVTTSSFVGVLAFETSLASARLASFTSDGTHSVYVVHAQCEDVTGQSDQTASEYVSSGTTPPNWFTYTEDLTNSAYANINTTITRNSIANPIDGVVNATKVEATSAAATSLSYQANGIGSASGMTCSIYIKKGSGATDANRFYLRNDTTATNIVSATVDFDAGTTNAGTLTSVGSGWYKLVLSSASGFSNGDDVKVYLGFVWSSETANEFCYVYGPTLVQGVSDPTYTPVGAAYDPHGSGADGVKYFKTNKDLTSISPSVLKGYLTEGAATNNLLWNRDLTNAAWTKSNMTTALTATGIDGQVNVASVLTATAGNATCLQPRTLASAVRSFSAFVRRKTGTGTISITRDGGTTWTDITLLLNTASYVRVSIENSTVLNPSCGFRITTSADAIEVDYCQDEAGYVFSNPILTTTATATRNQDFLSYPVAGNVDGATGSASASWGVNTPASTISETQIAISRGTGGRFLYHSIGFISGRVSTYDSTNLTASVGLTRNTPVVARAAVGWSGSTMSLIAEGAASVSSNTFDGSFGTELSIYIGGIGTATWPLYGNVKNVYFWSGRLTDTQLKQAANA
jgi:hypothetical protein